MVFRRLVTTRLVATWCVAVMMLGLAAAAATPKTASFTGSLALGTTGSSPSTVRDAATGVQIPASPSDTAEALGPVPPPPPWIVTTTTSAQPIDPWYGGSASSVPPGGSSSSSASPPTTTPSGPAITGYVETSLGLPIIDVPMCVYAFGTSVPSTPVALDGSFQFDTMAPSELVTGLVLVAESCTDVGHTAYMSPGLQLAPGALPAHVTITAFRMNALFGTIVDLAQEPVANACVLITSPDSVLPLLPPQTTRADGSYGPIESIPSGTYFLEVRADSCLGPKLDVVGDQTPQVSFPTAPMRFDMQIDEPL
ncbi:MAG: hypothetical protein QOG30_475 [Acidimicrobiaceae bacterium]|jgi:hypothetical protein